MKKGEFSKAILDYSAVLEKIPNDISSLYNRGCCYDKLGQTNEVKKKIIFHDMATYK